MNKFHPFPYTQNLSFSAIYNFLNFPGSAMYSSLHKLLQQCPPQKIPRLSFVQHVDIYFIEVISFSLMTFLASLISCLRTVTSSTNISPMEPSRQLPSSIEKPFMKFLSHS